MNPEWQKLCVPDNERWNAFCTWADANGIGTAEDDWKPWWKCWEAGAEQEAREWEQSNPLYT